MDRYLGRLAPFVFAILRIVAAVMYLLHGTQKLFAFPAPGQTVALTSLFGVAGIIEIVAGTLIAIGLFASYAAFIASGEMAVAYFMMHFPRSFWPSINHGEVVILFCFLFLYIACKGPGILSIDAARGKARST